MTTAEIDRSLVSTQFLHLVGEMDLLAVDLISFLLADSTAELQGSYATEDLAAGTGFGSDLHSTFFQFSDHFIDCAQHKLLFLLDLLSFFLELFQVGRTGFHCKLL